MDSMQECLDETIARIEHLEDCFFEAEDQFDAAMACSPQVRAQVPSSDPPGNTGLEQVSSPPVTESTGANVPLKPLPVSKRRNVAPKKKRHTLQATQRTQTQPKSEHNSGVASVHWGSSENELWYSVGATHLWKKIEDLEDANLSVVAALQKARDSVPQNKMPKFVVDYLRSKNLESRRICHVTAPGMRGYTIFAVYDPVTSCWLVLGVGRYIKSHNHQNNYGIYWHRPERSMPKHQSITLELGASSAFMITP
ncbi:MAG: hypothetical protein AAF355_09600 [Myxococcota bacterium]